MMGKQPPTGADRHVRVQRLLAIAARTTDPELTASLRGEAAGILWASGYTFSETTAILDPSPHAAGRP